MSIIFCIFVVRFERQNTAKDFRKKHLYLLSWVTVPCSNLILQVLFLF